MGGGAGVGFGEFWAAVGVGCVGIRFCFGGLQLICLFVRFAPSMCAQIVTFWMELLLGQIWSIGEKHSGLAFFGVGFVGFGDFFMGLSLILAVGSS